MKIILSIECPYCNNEKKLEYAHGTRLVYCEGEDGGCNNEFIAKGIMATNGETATLTLSAHGIEGLRG